MNVRAFRLSIVLLLIGAIAPGAFFCGASEAQCLFPPQLLNLLTPRAVPRQTTQTTYLVSVGPDGEPLEVGTPAYGVRLPIDMSADGRYVAFMGYSEDSEEYFYQVWVHDRLEGLTRCVSVSAQGEQANASCWWPSVSDDGRYTLFSSYASNLVAGLSSGWNSFVHDAQTGGTTCINVGLGNSLPMTALSGDGGTAAFSVERPDGSTRIYRCAIATGVREIIPIGSDEPSQQRRPALNEDGAVLAHEEFLSIYINGINRIPVSTEGPDVFNELPEVSDDGRYVSFHRYFGGGQRGVFRYQRSTGAIAHVSRSGSGENIDIDPAAGSEVPSSINHDGRYIVFTVETRFSPAVYVRDMQASSAQLLIANAREHCINGDGRFIGYTLQGVNVMDRQEAALEAPTDLQVAEVEVAALQAGDEGGELLLNWQDNASAENAFQIHLRRAQLGTGDWEPWEWLEQVGQNVTEYRTGQIASGRYQFRVRAINTGNLRMSQWCVSPAFDLGEVDFPLPPSNLGAEMTASNSADAPEPNATLHVTWLDNSDDEIAFELQQDYRQPGGNWAGWEQVAVLDAGVTSTDLVVPLLPGDYRLRLRAQGASGDSPWAVSPTFTVTPPAPFELAVQVSGPADSGSVPLALSWHYYEQHRHRFDLQWRRVTSGQFEWGAWEEFDYALPANLREWTAEAALGQAGAYQFRIRAGTEDVNSAWVESNILDFRPEVPSRLQVTMSGSDSINDPARASFTPTWWDNSDNEIGFRLERRRRDVSPTQASWTDWVLAGIADPDSEQMTVDLPLEPAEYQFRIHSFNDAGASEWAESPIVTCELPAPELLAAAFAGESANGAVPVSLSWEYPQAHVHLFNLQVRRFSLYHEQWTAWEDEEPGIGADRRQWDSSVDPLTYGAYQWRLRATGAGMNSFWNPTQELDLTPEAPTTVEGQMVASTSVSETPLATLLVTWEDNSDDETGLEIEVYHIARETTSSKGISEWTPAGTAPANATQARVEVGMLTDQCKVRVRSVHQAGNSDWEESFYLSLQPPAPTELAFGREGPLQDPEGDPHFLVPLSWQYGDDHMHDFRIESRRMDVGSSTWSQWGEDWGWWTAEWSRREHDFAVWPPADGIAKMQWRIRAGGPVPSEWLTSAVMNLVPEAPTNLQAEMIASDSDAGDPVARLRMTWEDSSSNENRFSIWMRRAATTGSGQVQTRQWGEWELLRSFPEDATAGTVEIPQRPGEHQLRICASGSAADSEWVESDVFILQPPAPTELAFGPPGAPQMSDDGAFVDIPLSWSCGAEHVHDFSIEMRRRMTAGGAWTEWGGGNTFDFDWDLAGPHAREKQFRVFSGPDGVGHSVQWRIQTLGPVPSEWHESGVLNLLPEAPSKLQVQMIASDSRASEHNDNFARLRATWEDNSIGEFAFELMYRHRFEGDATWQEWLPLGEYPQDATEGTNDILPGRADYQMRVVAKGPGGYSDWAESAVFTLEPPPATNMRAEISGPANEQGVCPVELTWDYSDAHRHPFEIYWRYIVAGQSDWSDWAPHGVPVDHDGRTAEAETHPELSAYQWRVRATSFSGNSEWCESNVLDLRTPAPSNLQVAMIASDSRAMDPNDNFARIRSTWQDNSNDETGFAVWMRYRYLDWTGAPEEWTDWTLLSEHAANSTAATKSLPLRNAEHQLRVCAIADGYNSDWALSELFTLRPPVPTNMSAAITGPPDGEGVRQVSLTWDYNDAHRHQFEVYWRYIPAGESDWSEWAAHGMPIDHDGRSSSGETHSLAGTYQWRVRATSFSGNSEWCESNVLSVPPLEPDQVAVTPGALNDAGVPALNVSWVDRASDEQGFTVQHRWRPWMGDTWSGWQPRAELAANATGYEDRDCEPGTHQYRVRAFHETAASEWVASPTHLIGLPSRTATHWTSYDRGVTMIAMPVRPEAGNVGPIQFGVEPSWWARWLPGDGSAQGGHYVYWQDDPQGYASLADTNRVPGKGYWANFAHDTTAGIGGEVPDPEGEYVIEIGPAEVGSSGAVGAASPWHGGWVQIGSPRLVDVPWIARGAGALRVRRGGAELTLSEAQAAGWCEDFAWGYEAGGPEALVFDPAIAPVGSDDRMRPWRGYWFLTHGPCELVIPPVSASVAAAASARPKAAAAPGDWTLRLLATLDEGEHAEATIGQAMTPRQVSSPPVAPAGVQLALLDGEQRLGVDLRSQALEATWDLEVLSAVPGGNVTLTWPDMSGLPPSARPLLVDSRTGKRTYMRTTRSYSFHTGETGSVRRLQIMLLGEEECMLAVSGLLACGTRDGGAEVRMHLSSSASVDVELLNISGRTVATVCRDREMEAGTNTLHWNGRGNSNTRLPHGRYVVRVTARSAEGQQTGALGTLQLGN